MPASRGDTPIARSSPDSDPWLPEPELVTRPRRIRRAQGNGSLYLPDEDRWAPVHPACLDILELLEDGVSLAQLHQRMPDHEGHGLDTERGKRKLVRRFVWNLHRHGIVDLNLPEPPAVFDGRYRRVRELGRGGMGVVHLCEDLEAGGGDGEGAGEGEGEGEGAGEGRLVAVKHPWGVKHDISTGHRALAREILALERLEHPCLPAYHGGFERDGLLHLVREYVDGESLSALTRRGLFASGSALRSAARQVAHLLAHIHQRGGLCRDLAPGNFLVTERGRVVLVDLGGIVFPRGDRLRAGGRSGTPGYMAPEVAGNAHDGPREGDTRSDVYAFGCLYYRLATGQRPGEKWGAGKLQAAVEEKVGRGELGRGDGAVVLACCQREPDERPRDGRALLELLVDL